MATTNFDTTEDELETKDKTNSETEDDCSSVEKITSSKRQKREEKEKCIPEIRKLEFKKLKKNSFFWSWTDECTILEKFLEFAGTNGSYSKDFYHSVKNKLTVEVSNSQLSDKVYRLRKRFLKDEARMEETKLKLCDPNYEKLFEMSKQIWGCNKNQGDRGNTDTAVLKSEAVDQLYSKLFENFFTEIKFDMNCIPPEIVADIRRDWENMKMAKNEYELKHAQLLVEISDIRCSQNRG